MKKFPFNYITPELAHLNKIQPIVSVIKYTCTFPALTGQNVYSEKDL